MPEPTIRNKCPVCGSLTSKPARWFRIVRNLVRDMVLYASLNGRNGQPKP